MSSFKLLVRPVSKWIVPRRSIHSSAIVRATAEPETEAATARKYPQYDSTLQPENINLF